MLTRQLLQRSEEGIDNSEFYMVIVTDNMLKDEKCLYEWNYAKNKKRPFMLIIKKETIIPKDMLEGIKIIYEGYFENLEDLDRISSEIKQKWGTFEVVK